MITEQQIQAKAKEYADTNIGEYAGNVNEVEHYAWKSAVDVFTAGAEWALQQQRWIPVTERLPEIGENVLVCLETGTVIKGQLYKDDWMIYWSDGKSEQDRSRPVVAWQPLPEPYKPTP